MHTAQKANEYTSLLLGQSWREQVLISYLSPLMKHQTFRNYFLVHDKLSPKTSSSSKHYRVCMHASMCACVDAYLDIQSTPHFLLNPWSNKSISKCSKKILKKKHLLEMY